MIKMMAKSNVRRKGLIWFTSYYLLPVEAQAGTWHQELKQIPWRNTSSCLAPPGLLRLLSYALQDQFPRGCTIHNILGPPTSIISRKKMPHRLTTGRSGGSIFTIHILSFQWSHCVSSWIKPISIMLKGQRMSLRTYAWCYFSILYRCF